MKTPLTTPNDAPRPTSDLVKELRDAYSSFFGGYSGSTVNIDCLERAAASLQTLEARNKEIEGALTRIANMVYAGAPDIRMREIARAALHPATKTEER